MAMNATQEMARELRVEIEEAAYATLCRALEIEPGSSAGPVIIDFILNMPLFVLSRVDELMRGERSKLGDVAVLMATIYQADQQQRSAHLRVVAHAQNP